MPDELKRVGVVFTADGVQDFKTALSEVNSSISENIASFKLARSEWTDSTSATDKLKDRQSFLSRQTETYTDKVNLLNKELSQMENAENRDEAAISRKKAQVANAQSQLNKYKSELETVTQQLKSGSAAIEDWGRKLQTAGASMEKAGKTLTTNVTAPILAIGTAAAKTTADFDEQMDKVSAISMSTADEMESLRQKAKEMGRDTRFSASEAGQAMEYMAMAGWKTGDMLDGIAGVMDLAAASGEELGKTSDIVTDALTAFGLSAKDSSHFADVLAAASSNANTNVSMLGESFKYAAPVAGALGYSAEDTSIALGLMANAGIKASQGGTALRAALTNLSDPTDEMKAQMERFGISLTDAYGNMKSLREIMTDLRSSMSEGSSAVREYEAEMAKYTDHVAISREELAKMSAEEQNRWALIGLGSDMLEGLSEKEWQALAMRTLGREATDEANLTEEEYIKLCEQLGNELTETGKAQQAAAASALFGKQAMSGMLAVINASDEDFQKLAAAIDGASDAYVKTSEGIMTLADAEAQGLQVIEEYSGASAAMAAMMEDNLNGQVRALTSKLEGLAIQVGEILIPYLGEFVDWLQGIVDWLSQLDPKTQETIVKIAALAASIGPVLLVGGKLLSGIGSVMTLGAKLIGHMDDIMAAIGAVKGVVSGFVGFASTALQSLFALVMANPVIAIVAAIIAAVVLLYAKCEWFRDGVNAIFGHIHDFVVNVAASIKEKLPKSWEEAKQLVIDKVQALKNGVAERFESVRSGALEKIDALKNGVADRFEAVKNIVGGAIEKIKGIMNFHWELPRLKMPHFKINGSFSLNPPSVPTLGVDWYAKGGILTRPTVFGMNGDRLMAGGESGPEAVAPISLLKDYIRETMAEEKTGVDLASLATIIRDAVKDGIRTANVKVDLDGEAVGRFVGRAVREELF